MQTIKRSDLERRLRSNDNPGAAYAAIAELRSTQALGRFAELVSRATVMNIKQSGEDIVIEREGDYALVCDFVARKLARSKLGQERCGWVDNALVFDVLLPDKLLVRHRFILSEDRQRINVATTVANRRAGAPFTLNRVFMPYQAGEGQFACENTLDRGRVCTLGTD